MFHCKHHEITKEVVLFEFFSQCDSKIKATLNEGLGLNWLWSHC